MPIIAHVVWKFHSALSLKDVVGMDVVGVTEADILCGAGGSPPAV